VKMNEDILQSHDYYFLSVSHGMTVAQYERRYKIEFKPIDMINIFATHGENIGMTCFGHVCPLTNLGELNREYFPELIRNAVIRIVPNEQRAFALPPIEFSAHNPCKSDRLFSKVMGLWLYTKRTNTFINLYNIDYLIQLTTHYGGKITYSIIMKEINTYIKAMKLVGRIGLGFFNCRGILPQYTQEYEHISESITLKFNEEDMYPSLKQRNILDLTSPIQGNIALIPLYIKTKYSIQPLNWRGALAGVKHQGCGLNVLSFYSFMLQTMGREKTLCLTLKGTSIFRIIEYLHFYVTNRGLKIPYEDATVQREMTKWMNEANPDKRDSFPNDTNYMVFRFEIVQYIAWFLRHLSLFNHSIQDCMVIVKMYKELHQQGTTDFSHMGHSVSFYFKEHNVYLIDPQAKSYNQQNPEIPAMTNGIIQPWFIGWIESSKFTHFDTIWIHHTDITTNIIQTTPQAVAEMNLRNFHRDTNNGNLMFFGGNRAECHSIPYTANINYGGSTKNTRTKKSKTRILSKKSTTTRKITNIAAVPAVPIASSPEQERINKIEIDKILKTLSPPKIKKIENKIGKKMKKPSKKIPIPSEFIIKKNSSFPPPPPPLPL
jgi:hypothetical protein